MNRNYEEIIAEYGRITAGRDAIYCSDLNSIRDNSKDLFEFIHNAMMYGFVVGYRRAKNERKKKKKAKPKALTSNNKKIIQKLRNMDAIEYYHYCKDRNLSLNYYADLMEAYSNQ